MCIYTVMMGIFLAALAPTAPAQEAAAPDSDGWAIDGGWLTREGAAKRDTGDAVNMLIGDKGWVVESTANSQPSVHVRDDGGFEVVYSTPLGLLRDQYDPFPELGPDALRRSLHYRNTSGEMQDLLQAVLRVNPAAVSGGQSWSPLLFRMVEAGNGRALCVANWSGTDPHRFRNGRETGAIAAEFSAQWRLEPGQEASIHQQDIWLAEAGTEAFRDAARHWFHAHGFSEPQAYPAWLSRGVLYETCAGGHVEARFSDGGGFGPLAHQVDYLADLGVSAFWLNAVHEHKSPPDPVAGGWNCYAPRDLARVDPILGGMEGLKRLVEGMQAAGIHCISEAVPHGARCVQAAALDAWWTRGRDGELLEPWGGYGMDNASPEWQEIIGGWMARLALEVGIEGARVDVADGQGSNWGSPRTNHASYSSIGGGTEMLSAIRDGIARGPAAHPVLIPESPLHAEYFAVPNAAVVGYGFETTNFFCDHLPGDLSDAAAINRVLQAHFEDERGGLPPGALPLRTLNNHDTVVAHGRVQVRFGAGLARALYAVCLAVPGVPMLYQEEEIGSFHVLRALNWARRRIPELATGRPTYLPTSFFAPEVFSVMRSTHDGHALCLVNLSGNRITAAAALPGPLPDQAVLFEAISGKQVVTREETLDWTLMPYTAAFFRVARPPEGAVPPLRFSGEPLAQPAEPAPFTWEASPEGFAVGSGALRAEFRVPGVVWQLNRSSEGTVRFESDLGFIELHDRNGALEVACRMDACAAEQPPTVRIHNAQGWRVSGRTALLHDWLLRRHAPFPASTGYAWNRTQGWGARFQGGLYRGVMPSGRLWQSLLEPLHPDEPVVAFYDAGGEGLALTALRTDAMNVVLTDGSDESAQAEFPVELRFLAVDPDLHPNVQRFGLDQPWRLVDPAPVEPRALRLSFTITPLQGDAGPFMTASRLPILPRGARVVREGSDFGTGFDAIWTRQPGRITWRGLAPTDGVYHVEFELRHSEQGPEGTDLIDAYRIEIDHREQPLEWAAFDTARTGNAYFGRARTPLLDLSGEEHTISITTRRPWCAVRNGFHLRPGE